MQERQTYQKYLPLLGVLLLANFVLMPLWDAKEENYQELATTSYNLEKTRALTGLGEQMQQRKTELTALVKQAETAVVSGTDITQLKLAAQSDIEKLLRSHQLNLSNSNWTDGLGEADISTLYYECSFSGDLLNYLKFLQQFANNPSFAGFAIESSRLRLSEQTPAQPGKVDASLSIRLPVRLESAP
ncbi:hypothetical protein [Rheinheimera sp.]|uniref:hypothetical protein n=1 Tax=Rheinheimera sp. TaxID=1869214 RepID=UPI0027BAB165|nr:hypothetical protein [Rheinheimera sp.]